MCACDFDLGLKDLPIKLQVPSPKSDGVGLISLCLLPRRPFVSLSEQRGRLQAAIDDPDSLRLVVDLNWAEDASGKELSSLVKQLCYVYNRVKASAAPPTLTLTSFRGRAAEALAK